MVYKHIYIHKYIDYLITLILYYSYIKHIRNITFKQNSLIDKARKTVLKVLFISGDYYHITKSRSSTYTKYHSDYFTHMY